jgi:hypothetical protein
MTHPIASESLANPPLTRLRVSLYDCEDKQSREYLSGYEEEECYQPPESTAIENADGSPITVKDFVIRVHDYINTNKKELIDVKTEIYQWGGIVDLGGGLRAVEVDPERAVTTTLPENAKFFFQKVWYVQTYQECMRLHVAIWVVGEIGTSEETFWAIRRKAASTHQKL